jgi:hypothetical protein
MRRVALDRAIETGQFDVKDLFPEEVADAIVTEKVRPSPYADLGTCEHFELQDGLRCQFPTNPSEHAPTEEEWANAATLFENDVAECHRAVRTVAVVAAKYLPKIGKNWLAESAWENESLSGHIDFLDPDGEWLVDLKTTSKPPPGGGIKWAHLCQILAYRSLVPFKRAMVLYIDSQRGAWVCPVVVEMTDEMVEYQHHLTEFIVSLTKHDPTPFAIPQPGPWCVDDFCPYRPACKFPLPKAEVIDLSIVPTPANLFGGHP